MWLGLVFGALAAGFSIFQGIQRSRQAQAEIDAQKEAERISREARIKEQRESTNRGIDYAVQSFENEQEDAFRKADDIWHQGERIDMRADLDETLTGRAFNLAMQKNNMEDESLLLQQQRGKQNFLNRQGAQQTALGMSGARHGANSAEQLLAQNEQNFTQDLDLMNRQRETQKDINLMQAFTGLKRGMFGIDEERDQANMAFRDSKQLRDDYTGEIVNEDISDRKEAIRKEYETKKEDAIKASHKEWDFGTPAADDRLTAIIEQLDAEEKEKIKELEDSSAKKTQSGGRVVNLFNKKIYNARADLNGNIDLQNLDGGFKQAALDRARERADYTVMDGLTNAFQGFSSGFGMGSGVNNFLKNWGGAGGGTSGVGFGDSAINGINGGRRAFGNFGTNPTNGINDVGKLGTLDLFSDFTRSNALSARRYKDPFGFMFG
ncbi:hypothetical protein [Treponema vincentii]|uniref:hypothetical protein n=1 Tax=Treponema vincentii TaxID=69710 RepID=UPI0020A4493A|nr:hypothetical protein [Treponema vincentii]